MDNGVQNGCGMCDVNMNETTPCDVKKRVAGLQYFREIVQNFSSIIDLFIFYYASVLSYYGSV